MHVTVARVAAAVGSAAAIVLLLAGCQTAAPDPSSTSSTGQTALFPTTEELFEGSSSEPPTDGPAAAEGKSVWLINCGSACNRSDLTAQAATAAIGWDYNYADGNLNIGGGYATAIRTALASDPDAIILEGINCADARQPFQEAFDQGVPVVSINGINCDGGNGEPLFSVPNPKNETVGDDMEAWWEEVGKRAAWYLIDQTDGNLNVITGDGPDPLQHAIATGFQEEIAKCGGCEIAVSIDTPSADLVPNGGWISNFRSALVSNPDANGVFLPFDGQFGILGGSAAVSEARSEAILAGGLGLAQVDELIRDGKLTWTAAIDQSFEVWATIDNLNRYFSDVPAAPQGVGMTTVNSDNPDAIPPAGENFAVPFDYEAIYKGVWGK